MNSIGPLDQFNVQCLLQFSSERTLYCLVLQMSNLKRTINNNDLLVNKLDLWQGSFNPMNIHMAVRAAFLCGIFFW